MPAKGISLGDGVGDVVPRDDDDAANRPAVDEHDPEGVLEPGLVVIDGRDADGTLDGFPAEVNQKGRYDVLDAGSGITSGHPDEKLDAGGGEGDADRGQEGEQRKDAVAGVPRVTAA